jgi:hypothetical protein
MKRALILVEGQTEERFVKQVLLDHLLSLNLSITPTLLTTKVVKSGSNFKGGVTSFDRFESDLRRLLGGAGGGALVTSMLDYYRLPNSFPGMNDRPAPVTLFARIEHVEQALFTHFNDVRFLPFLALHEFEAWVFSCPSTLPEVMTEPKKQPLFAAVCNSVETPEQINESPGHNPAARIESIFPAYRKVLHGPTAAERIGLSLIRDQCAHFNEWLGRLEAFARLPQKD